ncbi:MAG: MnmC family methyltransferase [Steroidobacteraceae bacterium]
MDTAPASSLGLPLLTLAVAERLITAQDRAEPRITVSLDLGKSTVIVEPGAEQWTCPLGAFPYPFGLKERTVYAWSGSAFEPVSRFDGGLYKLVPTDWGPPTFEIDGIKMLPTARISPFEDAEDKVALIRPRTKRVLDCCGGLGYFAHWCLIEQAFEVVSYEKSEAVIWLRTINPWSPRGDSRLKLIHGDIAEKIVDLPDKSFDAILHDPPRFGTAGELYSQAFYDHLARVIRRDGLLFHYTGTPNRITSGRDVPREVKRRLEKAGFQAQISGDGVLAKRVAAGAAMAGAGTPMRSRRPRPARR